MRHRGALIVAVSCLVASSRSQARAASETEPIRIEYSAVSGCPSAAEFERQVLRRAVRARLAEPSESARVFNVELKRDRGQISGSLVIRERDGATIARRVSGADCEDVALVLALASALAIDPRAELEPQNGVVSEPLPHDEEATTPDDTGYPNQFNYPGEYDDGNSSRNGRRGSLGLSLGPRANVGNGPGPSLGGSLLLLAYPGFGRLSLGLEFAFTRATSQRFSGALADVQFLVARPRICPHHFPVGTSATLAPCLTAEVGIISGKGLDIDTPDQSNSFWFSVELPLRLDVPLSERWFLALEAGPGFPVTRYRIVFQNPETDIHSVATVTATGALHAGFRF